MVVLEVPYIFSFIRFLIEGITGTPQSHLGRVVGVVSLVTVVS